jgi:L,D-transpeptidase ErfK/SrfK
MYKKIQWAALTVSLTMSAHAFATTYHLPAAQESLVGGIQVTSAQEGDNVVTVAKKYDIGFNAMEKANPQLDLARAFQPGTVVKIPSQHLLPNQTRRGIVINLPEMRMYYYPAGSNQVLTYPIGIGKIGKTIPIKLTSITRKTKNPVWIPPQDIREFNLKQGIVLPRIMPAGPDNPLGPYAIYTGIPTYLIHSTIFPESVGKRASFGCIRMYESDIENFFPSITKGIQVAIINSPVKVGWQDDQLFIEAHEPLQEHPSSDATVAGMTHLVANTASSPDILVDWQLISYLAENKDGVPHQVGVKLGN